MKKIPTLILLVLFVSCERKMKVPAHIRNVNAKYYENTKTDTAQYSIEDISYNNLCSVLFIQPYTPADTALTGVPNSYIEDISKFPNYSEEKSEKVFRETNGMIYLDTADRDFKKYWYNEKGLLYKYENKSFGDIIHNECIFSYDNKNMLKEIVLNDVVTDALKYKNTTIKINNDHSITVLSHNIAE
ncbi:MAG: hypothetical protein QM737_22100 [Ferruginibacter sp.]